MNQLIAKDVDVTSLDIANVTGKRHADVMRDIRNEIEQLGNEVGQRIFAQSTYMNKQNRQMPCYQFTRKGAMQLALRYDPKTRFRVINYIEKLENDNKPQTQLEIMQMQINQMVEQEQRLSLVEEKQENIAKIISLNNNRDWRKETSKIINIIARNNGGTYQQTRRESYARLETRARCDLERRLENKIERMKKQGVQKRTVNNLNYLDVIADDDRLIEIYLAIVKEMAVEFGIDKAVI